MFEDGSVEHLWNTFGEEQIDLDVTKEVTMEFIRKTIQHLASNGCDLIRLDAFAYAVKKLDTCGTRYLGFIGQSSRYRC